MKKTILSVAVLLASTLGMTAIAQNSTTADQQNGCKEKTECTKGTKEMKGQKPNRPNPFEGLNLTEQQKAELKAIAPSKEMKSAAKDGQKQSKENCNNPKCDKAKGDKSQGDQAKLSKEAKQQMNAERRAAKIQGRRDYLAKVKNILTPEQYVQFLENNYVDQGMMKGNSPKKGMMAKNHKGAKGMKGMKGKNFRAENGRNAKTDKTMRVKGSGKKSNVTASNDNNGTYYIDNGKIKVFPYQANNTK